MANDGVQLQNITNMYDNTNETFFVEFHVSKKINLKSLSLFVDVDESSTVNYAILEETQNRQNEQVSVIKDESMNSLYNINIKPIDLIPQKLYRLEYKLTQSAGKIPVNPIYRPNTMQNIPSITKNVEFIIENSYSHIVGLIFNSE